MKLYRTFLATLLALTCCTSAFASETSPTRGKIALDGVWDFATDPDGVGETQNWFAPTVALPTEQPEGYAPKTPGKIQVPGIWDAQGYGVQTDKVNHNFVGKGWYKKTTTIPKDWKKDESIYLVLGGISRYAKVWIDGQLVGPEAVGCIGSHEWDVSKFVAPGKDVTIAICVDSAQRWAIDPLLGAASLNDYLEIKWGGLWGHVYLESRPKTRLDSVYLRTRLDFNEDRSSCATYCELTATLFDENKSEALSGLLRFELTDREGNRVVSAVKPIEKVDLSQGTADVPFSVQVPNAKLWSPDDPYLYVARVTFDPADSDVHDAIELKYGLREIVFDGPRILLNGAPFFLRGYGDDHIYPVEFSMSTDVDMYRNRLKLIKSFGFNHCRHHSCVLPHEYYDACDELGMLPNAEMLIGYPQQLPGEGDLWKKNVPEGTDPAPALETLKERWAAVVKEYRNHPSIFIWVGGNELCMLGWDRWNNMSLGRDYYDIAKKLDPARYFTDCDGDWLNEYQTRGPRKAEEFYSILFDEWSNPVLNHDKFKTDAIFDKPAVSHESGNFLTFSRQDQVELFDGCNYKPFWMVDGKAKLNELGLANEVEDWARASEQLYLLAHKYNVEGVRLNPNLSGYHWWLIQDYWTTSNGIFDLFFRPKSLKPADILPFNNDLVLLQKGFDFSYRSGDELKFEALISNFAGTTKNALNGMSGKFTWSLTSDDGKTLLEGAVDVKAANGTLTSCGEFGPFAAPEVDRATLATLNVSFKPNERDEAYANSWKTYIFPKEIAPKATRTIYADESVVDYFPKEWNVKSLAELEGKLPTDAVYAVAWATPEIIEAVENGAGLFHFNGSQFLSGLGMRFQQTWWKAGDSEEQNNTGTYVYPNAITDDVVYGNFCGAVWAALLDGAQKFNIETEQPRPTVFVRALSSLVRVRDAAILFEFGVGKGKVVVSGLNHGAAKDSDINAWLLARSVDQLANGKPADVLWDAKALVAPIVVPEGTTLGCERILKCAETGIWNSYRSMSQGVANWICRQNKVGNDLVWKTSFVGKPETETVSFIFAGTTGYASTPKTDGYVLSFNGADLIKFDVVDTFDGKTNQFVWKSEDGTATLQFDTKTELVGNDKYGIFTLTVPTSLVKPNQAQNVSVRSLGQGSSRWFGLNLYTDFSDLVK